MMFKLYHSYFFVGRVVLNFCHGNFRIGLYSCISKVVSPFAFENSLFKATEKEFRKQVLLECFSPLCKKSLRLVGGGGVQDGLEYV